MPESLTERSAKARAKKEDSTVEAVLQEWATEAGLNVGITEAATPVPPAEGRGDAEERSDDAGGQPTAAGTPTGAALPMPVRAPAPDSTQVTRTAAIATIDGGADHSDAKSDRLLTVIRAGEVQRIRSEPTDRVNVWPHLLAIEFVALLVVLILLITLAVFLDAPLLEFANFNEQPNPSKAPWYFLGLQELLAYFDPQVAGIIIPGFGLAALALIPYIDKNPSVRPSHRKLAIMIFTFFIMAAAVLTIFGSFFRGPGFNFTFPWHDGIFFDDLKSLLG
jgi:menaquinol-cytochrome c reductase cytochrome b/c subunit